MVIYAVYMIHVRSTGSRQRLAELYRHTLVVKMVASEYPRPTDSLVAKPGMSQITSPLGTGIEMV